MKFGSIAIVGKPNVGKSTFINTLLNKTVVISSKKPQTTRNRIEVIYKDEDAMIIVNDTPGLHTGKNKLDMFLNSQVKQSLKNCDVIAAFFDVSRPIDDEDKRIISFFESFNLKKVILILNKVDLVSKEKVEKYKNDLESRFKFCSVFETSSLTKQGIDELISWIKNDLEEYQGNIEDLYEIEKQHEDKYDGFFISELIREIIINKFAQEIPYSVAIVIEKMEYSQEKNLLSFSYSIVVEKESQKPIVIGKGGKNVKEINIAIRNRLSEFYDCKIFTESFVKVRKDWRDNNEMIKEFGYKK